MSEIYSVKDVAGKKMLVAAGITVTAH